MRAQNTWHSLCTANSGTRLQSETVSWSSGRKGLQKYHWSSRKSSPLTPNIQDMPGGAARKDIKTREARTVGESTRCFGAKRCWPGFGKPEVREGHPELGPLRYVEECASRGKKEFWEKGRSEGSERCFPGKVYVLWPFKRDTPQKRAKSSINVLSKFRSLF